MRSMRATVQPPKVGLSVSGDDWVVEVHYPTGETSVCVEPGRIEASPQVGLGGRFELVELGKPLLADLVQATAKAARVEPRREPPFATPDERIDPLQQRYDVPMVFALTKR